MQPKRVHLPNGIHLMCVDEGPVDAPVLMFLHGFPESHRTWRHQIRHFRDRYRCIAPDQRGYRQSSKPQEVEAYETSKLIGDIFLLADALGIANFTIVGHDWGGAIAWGVALAGQHMRVNRAIIANAPHPAIFQKLLYTNTVQREASQYIRAFRDTANDPLVKDEGLTGLLEKVVNWDNPGAMEPEERAQLMRDRQNRDAAFGMLNWYRASQMVVPAMDEPFALPADFTGPDLPKLTIATLVIWALDDLALPPENLDGMDEIIDPLTVVKVPDCGHFVPWEAPDAVNEAMDQFLQS